MQLEDHKIGSVLVVRPLMRRLDAAISDEFKQQMLDWIDAGNYLIVLDLSMVEFLDSSGLGAIVSVHKAIRQHGQLAVCGLTQNVDNLFRMTRMDHILPQFQNASEAARELGDPGI